MKHKREFKKYLHGGAILAEDEAREAGRIRSFGAALTALNQQIATVSAKFANQTAEYSDYEQIAALSKKLNDLFMQLLLGQLKYSMHLQEAFLHKATEVKDIDRASGKVREVIDIATQKVLPTVAMGTALYLGAAPLTGLAVGVGTLAATGELGKLVKAKYYQLLTHMQKLTYFFQSYKRYFQQLVNSFVYLTIFMPSTRRDMNQLFDAVEGAYKCQVNHSIALDKCVRSHTKMERYVRPDSDAPMLMMQYEKALDACRVASQAVSTAIAKVATYQGLGTNYINTELQNAQTLQGEIDVLVLEGTSFLQLYREYWTALSKKVSGLPASPKPSAPGPGAMQFGTDLPPVSSFPPPRRQPSPPAAAAAAAP